MNDKNTIQTEKNYSLEEFQNMERRSATKNEFFDGKILD